VVHFDERGLGFYALGYGKGAKRAAAVVVTSGTAVGNLLPSIMEAHHSFIPMLLLTADRPIELRECGANQACNQVRIFSSFLRWEIDLPPQESEASLRSIAAQGVFHTLANPPGPVQINCQLREPHAPIEKAWSSGQPIAFSFPKLIAPPFQTKASRGVIFIGALEADVRPILEMAKRLRWPVFADILSNARSFPTKEQILHFDPILKKGGEKPDFILHFGQRLTSKKSLEWPADLHVACSPYLQDPTRRVSHRVQSEIDSFCETFEAQTDAAWLAQWQQKDEMMRQQIEKRFEEALILTESGLMRRLSALIPEGSVVFLGNGMPIREADLFLFPRPMRGFFANRGLSGIDGNLATLAGLSEGIEAPIVAILGDQACLHDLNSLALLKKTKSPITLIVSNNFGGGIFSHLPLSQSPYFETHIAASHAWRFEKWAEMFGMDYASSLENISFQRSSIVELNTCRRENYRFHAKNDV
jgi:2-succinyl-5-enolpyruvyl-6-hydroxy-3-cyclohexene-1-carboxylate synthase